MPAALGPCTGCGSTASKYKCPTCLAPTCSLVCSKGHRTTHGGGSEGGPVAGPSQVNQRIFLPTPRSSSALSIASPSSSTLQRTSKFIPLKDYDENAFMHDYHFLSSMGRHVSSFGAELMSNGMLPQQIEANLGAVQPGGSNREPNRDRPPGPTFRPDFETVKNLRRREALKEEVKRRRCKIMWLPDGMGRSRTNRTKFDDRDKKMRYTIDVVYPALSDRSGSGSSTDIKQKAKKVYHDIPPMLPVQVKLMQEMERASMRAAPKDWQVPKAIESGAQEGSKRGKKRRKGPPENSDADAEDQTISNAGQGEDAETPANYGTKARRPFYISPAILSQHGVPDPNHTQSPGTDSSIPQAYSALPPHIVLAVQIHSSRLRNESTLKYLEWWERKGREMDDIAAREKIDAEQREKMEAERSKLEAWNQTIPTGPRSMRTGDIHVLSQEGPSGPLQLTWQPQAPEVRAFPPVEANPATSQSATSSVNPLFSSSLLANLSAKLNKATVVSRATDAGVGAKEPTNGSAISETVAKPKTSLLAMDYGDDSDEDVDGVEEDVISAPPASSSSGHAIDVDQDKKLSSLSKGHTRQPRSLYVLPPSMLGVEPLLRSLPREHAVVEYATIEVWERGALESAIEEGLVRKVEHEVDGDAVGMEAQAEEKQDDEEAGEDEEQEVEVGNPSQPPRPAKAAKTTPLPGSLLSGYESDSSDSAASNVGVGTVHNGPLGGEDQLIQESTIDPVARSELLSSGSTPAAAATASLVTSEDEGQSTPADTGLASMARQLGFAPTIPGLAQDAALVDGHAHPHSAALISGNTKLSGGPGAQQEEEVDWDA